MPTQPERWHLLTQLKNYSDAKADIVLKLSVAGQPLLQHSLVPWRPINWPRVNDEFTTAQGGLLEAQITPSDDLTADDRATVYVPAFRPVRVAVFTSRKSFENDLRPVLDANPYMKVEFVKGGAAPGVDVSIYDVASPPANPAANAIYFVRGQGTLPRPIRVTDWNPEHPATRWVRTRDISVRSAATLKVRAGDVVLASGEGTPAVPLIVASEQNHRKSLIVGFDPHDSNFPQQPAFPLLIAGSVEWMTHPIEDVSDSLSAGELDLPGPAARVIGPDGADVPFARNGGSVHILALDTGLYRVVGANRTTDLRRERSAPGALAAARAGRCRRHVHSIGSNSVSGKLFVAHAGDSSHCGALGRVVAVLLGARQPAGGAGAATLSGYATGQAPARY